MLFDITMYSCLRARSSGCTHGRRQEFFQGEGGKPLGGAPKMCEGGPPIFFFKYSKICIPGGGGVVLVSAEFFVWAPKYIKGT